MKRLLRLTPIVTIAAMLISCGNDTEWTQKGIDRAAAQLKTAANEFSGKGTLPRTVDNGEVTLVDTKDWTSGFFPGSLWYAYQLTGDEQLKKHAVEYTALLEDIQYYTGNHDIGFMMFCSYGNQLKTTGDECVPDILLESANSLCTRYNDTIGLIRSWHFGPWNYPVIIDNMMNLELLFWASEHSGNPKYKDIAIKHADNTIKNHFREDNSTYHVVSYNNDGGIETKCTHQGYSDDSSWARGQAWALYGYTVAYRFTGLDRYLNQARKVASLVINNANTPQDNVPYWDYNDPEIPNSPRDASAAAITASALLELSTMVQDKESEGYFDYAERALKTLTTDEYLAAEGSNGGFILKHSTGHKPNKSEIDVPLNYADYYYLEGLKRYIDIKKGAKL